MSWLEWIAHGEVEALRVLELAHVVEAVLVWHVEPHAEPVLKTLKHYNLKPEDAVVVGDTHFDILMGRNAHCMTIGVTYGNGLRESLMEAGADAIVDDFAEIAEIV